MAAAENACLRFFAEEIAGFMPESAKAAFLARTRWMFACIPALALLVFGDTELPWNLDPESLRVIFAILAFMAISGLACALVISAAKKSGPSWTNANAGRDVIEIITYVVLGVLFPDMLPVAMFCFANLALMAYMLFFWAGSAAGGK